MLSPKSSISSIDSGNASGSVMSHRIPHRFGPLQRLSPVNCDVCKKTLWSLSSKALKCKDCGFICHEKCKAEVGLSCGLSVEMVSSAMEYSNSFGSKKTNSSSSTSIPSHSFQPQVFPAPTACTLCDKAIWGINGQGLSCSTCSCNVHEACLKSSGEGRLIPCSVILNSSLETQSPEVPKKDVYPPDKRVSILQQQQNSMDRSINRRVGSSMGKDTLMRLSRRNYAHSRNLSDVLNTSSSSDKRLRAPSSATEEPPASDFQRRVHHFRGHEFQAAYLEATDGRTSFDCQKCTLPLGDGGKQCYQCRLCKYFCHKKCYTHATPCQVSFCAFASRDIEDDEQTGVVYYRNSIRNPSGTMLQGTGFAEDFSDELIRLKDIDKDSFKELMRDYIVDEEVLGSGQYGIVKRGCYRHSQKEKIAIKVIDKKRFWDPSARSGKRLNNELGLNENSDRPSMPTILKRELDILKKLDHPGIIRMHNFIDTATHTYIIMDMATDGDLLDYIMRNKKIPEKETKKLMRQVFSSLKYLHDNGVVHRDLKPENILLSKVGLVDYRAQLADFGFATMMEKVGGISPVFGGQNMLKSIVGTPAYMAPEIVDVRIWNYVKEKRAANPNQRGYDESADMWSLGVILYVALGGVFPFDSQQPILDQILRGEFFFPDEHFGDVSDAAVDLICHLLSVNPLQRLSCHDSLNHAWFKEN